MNSFIETLNQWGGNFLSFAWPMLWQSSLLIAFVFALDFLSARKIRASIRYALWLVVLVKLCLPPTLALPTSAAWWLFPNHAAARPPALPKYVVTYDSTAPSGDFVPATTPAFSPPEPKLNAAGWTLLGGSFVSVVLLLWLTFRWWQISRKIRRATPAEIFTDLLDEIRRRAGLRSPLRLKLVDGRMSPAVCGLFRPVVLLPQVLADQLSDRQLRAVLLHEAIHLRRNDVWVNCAQALLQIAYWWHPLLWLANVRIRRLREEAVDDAVMLALRSEAEEYAPTLLAVAKLAFSRPLVSLGLVGIMESRSALRKRIERLVNFRAPRKAGVTFLSLCGIFVFSAVGLPMGEAPGTAEEPPSVAPARMEEQSMTVKVDPDIFIRNVMAQGKWAIGVNTNDYTEILLNIMRRENVDCSPPHGIAFNTKTGEITTENTPEQLKIFEQVIGQLNRADGKHELRLQNTFPRRVVLIEARCFWIGADARDKLISNLQVERGRHESSPHWIISPEQFGEINQRIASMNLRPFQRPRIQTADGTTAQFFVGDALQSGQHLKGVEFDCTPFEADKGLLDGQKGIALAFQTEIIGNPTGPKQELLGTTHYQASGEVGVLDHGGFIVSAQGPAGSLTNVVMVVGLQIVTNTTSFPQRLQRIIKPTLAGAPIPSNILVADGKVLYEMGKFDEAEDRLKSALALNSENGAAKYYLELVHAARQASGITQTGPDRKGNLAKMNQIHLIRFGPFDGLTLDQVVQNLGEAIKQKGILLTIASNSNSGPASIDPAIGLEFRQTELTTTDARSVTIHLFPALENVSLLDALKAVTSGASRPIHFSIQDDVIVFSEGAADGVMLFSRTFKVDARVFSDASRNISGSQGNNVSATARSLFSRWGVELKPPESVYYKDRLGLLFVRATLHDLDMIEKGMQTLNQPTPQIHIKARFLAVPKGTLNGFGNFGNMIGITNQPDHFTGILTSDNAKVALNNLEPRPGVEELAEPEVTTTSGRQTQMRATRTITLITNFTFEETATNTAIFPQTTRIEAGPILDVVPTVSGDGYTIDLTTIASVTEFLGYDKTTNTAEAYTSRGQKLELPTIMPAFAVRKASTNIRLLDGQTAVLGALKARFYEGGKEVGDEPDYFVKTKAARGEPGETDKELLVFITVTLVDPAGNRVHSDDEMPFARNSIPPQSGP